MIVKVEEKTEEHSMVPHGLDQPSIKKNYTYSLFLEVLRIIIPIIITPYISRVLGADGIGQYSYSFSIVTYFMLLGALGTVSYGTREIACARKEKKDYSKLFWEIESITVVSNAICLFAWLGITLCVGHNRAYFWALTPFILSVMFDISWLFNGLEKIKELVLVNSLFRIIGVVALFVFVKKKDDLLLYFIINSCVAFVGNLSMWLYLPKILVKVDIRTLTFKHHIRETLMYFIPSIASSVYTVLDKTLIGVITKNSFQNGYYEQASKIINVAKSLVFIALNTVMTARLSYLFSEEKYNEARGKIIKSMDYIVFLGMGAVFGLIGVSKRFVPFFFGKGYEPVIGLICLMVPLIVIIGISNCLGSQYYTPIGKRAESAKYIVLGALVNLFLNIILIPFFDAKGAVLSSIVAEIIITYLYIKNCENYIKVRDIMSMIWRRIFAGISMCIMIYLIGEVQWNSPIILIIQIITGIFIYGVILLLLKDDVVSELIAYLMKKKQVSEMTR